MNSILHFHAKMRPKTDFSFTLSEWRNPDYVSHGHKALILLLRSAPCSMHSVEERGEGGEEVAGDTGEVKYPPAFGQPACRSKDPTSPCLLLLLCCSLPVPSPPPPPLLSVSFNTFSERTPLTFCMPFVGQRIRFRTFSLLQN